MNDFVKDLRHAFRQIVKAPVFCATVILTLALGIGANTAVFSVMNATLLKYLPAPHPEELYTLQSSSMPHAATETGVPEYTFNYATFDRLRVDKRVFSDLMAVVPLSDASVPVRVGGRVDGALGDIVSGNFFTGLGIRPEEGQLLTPLDEVNHSRRVVLSFNYWKRRFNEDRSIVGQVIYIKSVPFTVAGVAARSFSGVAPLESGVDFWVPFQIDPRLNPWGGNQGIYNSPRWRFLMLIGRLQSHISPYNAILQLTPAFQRATYEGIGTPETGEVMPKLVLSPTGGFAKLRANSSTQYLAPLAMVAIVLLIACLNVTMLMVARNTSRQREFAVRVALGATPYHLVRQLVAETLLLTSIGTTISWIAALWATRIWAVWAKLDVSVSPDRNVLCFTLVVAGLVALGLSLAPALKNLIYMPDLANQRLARQIGNFRKWKFLNGRLIVSLQVGFCVVLLVATSLLIRTLHNLETADLGFHATNKILLFGVNPQQIAGHSKDYGAFFRTLLDRIETVPGVVSVTAMGTRIGSGSMNSTDLKVDGVSPTAVGDFVWNDVSSNFSRTLGIPLLMGRVFNKGDMTSKSKVVLVDKTFAERYFPGGDPLGHKIQISPMDSTTIVGVIADSKYTDVRQGKTATAYLLYTPGPNTVTLAVRSYQAPMSMLHELRQRVASINPDLALLEPRTVNEQFAETYSEERNFARLAAMFGFLASTLVAIGLYGVMAYDINRRTSEIGVRLALGAQRSNILSMILIESLSTSAVGLCIGLPLALLSTHLLGTTLYKLSPFDPLSFLLAALGIIVVALAAGYIPARRAARVEPMSALRNE